jgi:threonine dehydratase
MVTHHPERIVHQPASLEAIEETRRRLTGIVLRTPLVRLDVDDAPAEIYLKLECLQPIRSFKLRGAANAMLKAGREALADGVWTASAGNMAQGVAWAARRLGIPCTVVVPETAPQTKIAAVRRYGGTVITVPVDEWVTIFRTRHREGMTGVFVHPYSDPDVMAGNGTIGLEIVEDLPDVDAVIVPWGGGGLCCGIARRDACAEAVLPRLRLRGGHGSAAGALARCRRAGGSALYTQLR